MAIINPTETEKTKISELSPSDLPSPPQAAARILRACADDNSDHGKLAKLVALDPVLTAEILRIANSPFFGLGRKVESLSRAISIIGQRALRNMVLCIVVRDLVNTKTIAGLDIKMFWEDTLRRAVSAQLLGRELGFNADDCFTVGLLQEFGLLALLYLNPQKSFLLPQLYDTDPDTCLDLERQHFLNTHDHAAKLLAQTWQLPESFAEALGQHHQVIGEPKASTLSKMLYCADWMAAVYSCSDKGEIIDQCRCVLDDMFSIDAVKTNSFLALVPTETEKSATLLGLTIQHQVDFDEVLREANIKLAEANLSYQELTWELEKAIQERDRLAAELHGELQLAREIQQSLLPKESDESLPFAGINVSAKQLSGDFYDFFPAKNGATYFILGDVSGKGMNAALLMAKTCSLFRCLGKKEHHPGELVSLINNEICETSVRGMFVTLIVGLYDPCTGAVRLINAGHPPGILFDKSGKIRLLEAQAPPLGVVANMQYNEVCVHLHGGNLYLFSDGVTEGHTQDGSELGIKGLAKWIKELEHLPLSQQLMEIVSRFQMDQKPLRDDITMLALEDISE